MADDERPPEITPWGEKEEPDKFFGGLWWVTGSIHGGLYLTAGQRKAIPESLKEYSRDGDGIWWEENSAWSLPVMCLLSGRPESSLTEEEQEKLYFADQTCRDEYPREWEQLTGRRLMPGESRTLDGEIEERHGFDESGPLERGTRFHTLVLAADEDEQARNAGRAHMQVVHAGDEGNEFTKTYGVPAAIARELELVENKPENLAAWLAGKGCKLDCDNAPAVVERRADGEIRETWYRDGHWHRDDGPALVERAADGSTLFEDYFLEGGRVAKEAVVFPERGTFDALLAAAERGETAEVNRLLQSGANIHGCDDAPLRAASLHGHGETVRALIVAGAKLDSWDEMALRCMVHRGDTETVKFLLEKGAHIFAIEDKVYEDIERQGRSELAGVLRDAEAARMGASQDDGRGEMSRVTEGAPEAKSKRAPTPEKEAEAEPLKDRSPNDERPPEKTPWGDRDKPDELVGGFWRVNASRHAGLYLMAEQRKVIPESLKAHSRDGEGIWWEWSEGNSAWSLPVVCLLSGRPEASLSGAEQQCLYFADQECRDNYPREWETLTGRKVEPRESLRRDDEKELTVHNLTEDPWLVLDHPIPETADPQLLKAARAAAVVCRYEAEDLIAHDPKDPHAPDLKKIDAVFADIRHRLGEPEPAGIKLDPETEKTLEQHEKSWKAQPQKQHDRER